MMQQKVRKPTSKQWRVVWHVLWNALCFISLSRLVLRLTDDNESVALGLAIFVTPIFVIITFVFLCRLQNNR